MDVSEALLTFCVKSKNIFISAFPAKIIIGNIQKNCYTSDAIELQLCDLNKFYFAVIKIFKNLDSALIKESIFKKSKTFFWQVKESAISIGIEDNNSTIYRIEFHNCEEFSEFIDVFQKCILPSLCLPIFQRHIFDTMANLPIDDLVEFQERKKLSDFLTTNFKEVQDINLKNAEEIVLYYLEEIVLLQKFRSMKIPSITSHSLDAILNSD